MSVSIVVGAIIFTAIIVYLYKLNQAPINRDPNEVKRLLKTLLDGKYDSEWDDFENIKIKNPKLEDIRQECIKIYSKGSPYLSPTKEQPARLNSEGINKVNELIDKCS